MKSTFERELEKLETLDYTKKDVLSAKEKAKKEILKEIDIVRKKHNYRILGSFYDGLEKTEQIIKEHL